MNDAPLRDELAPRPVLRTTEVFQGAVWSVRSDAVDLGAAGVVERDYVVHPGAVAVLALDDADRALIVHQYRHPVRSMCWELPAGLRDVADEPLVDTARRELAEETDHTARRWFELVTVTTTSGGSTELLTVFLARDVSPVPERDRHLREGEELGMEVRWVTLDALVDGVLAGDLRNPSLITGVLAAHAHRATAWANLRPITPS